MSRILPTILCCKVNNTTKGYQETNKKNYFGQEHSFITAGSFKLRNLQASELPFEFWSIFGHRIVAIYLCGKVKSFILAIKQLLTVASKCLRYHPREIKRIRLRTIIFLCGVSQESYAKKCTGEFVNPISDICWSCLFPITIGRFEIIGSELYDTKNPSSPICICPKKIGGIMVPVPGIVGGFWEPARMVDVSAEPYCFVNMGGLEINMGFDKNQGGRPKASSSQISRWYVHYYAYPILYLLELFTDFICLDEPSFDMLWISEIDPTGMDDELAMILHPEGFLFNNMLAQAACSADCTSASLGKGMPLDSLYWCSGCQGSMFPMNGSVNAHIGGVQASINAAQKMTFKMHRQGMAHECSSDDVKEICSKRLALQMKKSHYRYQMVNPDTADCAPFGKSTTFFETNKERPIVGEDFGYLIWRKKSCCIF